MRCLLLFVAILVGSLPLSSAWVTSTTLQPNQAGVVSSSLDKRGQNVLVVDTFSMGNEDGTDGASQRQQSTSLDIRIPEPRLLAVDLISVAIAAHLMAFADVMTDPLQFAPPHPSPLPALIQRDSLLTVCWVLSALSVNGYQQETVASNLAVVKSTTKIATGFTVLRVVLGVVAAYFAASTTVDGWETARQCYITTITVGALRFFYGQCNR